MDHFENRLLRSVPVDISQDAAATRFSMAGVLWSCANCRRHEEGDNCSPDTFRHENLMMLPHGVMKLVRIVSEDNSLQVHVYGVGRRKQMACNCNWFGFDPEQTSVDEHQDAINAIVPDYDAGSTSRFFTPVNDAAGSSGLNDSLFFRTADLDVKPNDHDGE